MITIFQAAVISAKTAKFVAPAYTIDSLSSSVMQETWKLVVTVDLGRGSGLDKTMLIQCQLVHHLGPQNLE